jgi:hypothetical protein
MFSQNQAAKIIQRKVRELKAEKKAIEEREKHIQIMRDIMGPSNKIPFLSPPRFS